MTVSYQPQYRVHGATQWINFGNPVTATTVTITGLSSGNEYDFQVVAINDVGSASSTVISASTETVGTAVGDSSGTPADRIADLMEQFGVNTFSSTSATANTWGAYPADYSTPTVIAALNWLTAGSGLTIQIREYHYADKTWQSSWCPTVAQGTGAVFTMAIAANGAVSDVASMMSMASSSSTTTGWLKWVEGLNEPNTNFGNGIVAPSITDQIQEAIWSSAETITGNEYPVTVAGPSIVAGLPNPEGYITPDYAAASDMTILLANSTICNCHFYPPSECDMDDTSSRGGAFNDIVIGFGVAYDNQPIIITEWHPTLYNSDPSLQLDPTYDAYYTPCYFLSAFRAGIEAWFWYCLFDFGTAYLCGLFPQNATNPRPAAYVIRAMYQLTGDSSAALKHSFTPGLLNFTIANLQSALANAPNTGGQYMLFQNSAGTFFLFVWNVQVNPGGAPNEVTITFNDKAMTSVTEYDLTSNPTSNTTALQTLTDVLSLTTALDASVHLFVIEY